MIQTNTERAVVNKALVLGLVLATLMALSLMLTAKPAHAATAFTVNDTGDSEDVNVGDGECDAFRLVAKVCTLRAAIQEANHPSNPGRDTIEFEIGGSGAIGVKTITPASKLPTITETVTIDGYSQPGSSPNTLEQGTNAVLTVELDGSSAGNFSDGLFLGPGASNSTVKGLLVNRFGGHGITILEATDVTIEGNFIGTDASGTQDLGNGLDGVLLNGDANSNTIGGALLSQRNLVSGNGEGINLNFDADGNEVLGNLIGTQKDGTSPLENDFFGVAVRGADNFIGNVSANTIAFNGRAGVSVGPRGSSGTGNLISSNSIFSNAGLGIDLQGGAEDAQGATANDAGDADTGSNDLQNFPVLSSAKTGKRSTTVVGNLNSTPNTAFTLQFFSNSPGGADEGKTLIGEKSVTTGSGGKTSFTFKPAQKVLKGQFLTATATDPEGNTSEFSAPKKVVRVRR